MEGKTVRASEQRRKLGLHVCPCGQKAVRFTSGCWTCQPCLDKDAIYGSANCRGVAGVRYRDKGQITTCS